jgi:NUMOD3 motif
MGKMRGWVVYWLFDDRCRSKRTHGYVGAVARYRLSPRMWQHRQSGRWSDFRVEIIFTGSKRGALALERELRPRPGIGWNIGVGGFADGGGLKGIPKSPEQRAKMRAAALKRYRDPAESERTSRAVKKGLKGIDRTGSNNPSFGKPMSEAAKRKVRKRIAERGGLLGKNNPNYRHGRYAV